MLNNSDKKDITPFASLCQVQQFSLCQVQNKIRLIRNYYSEVIGPEGWKGGGRNLLWQCKYQQSTARIVENENEISPKMSQ